MAAKDWKDHIDKFFEYGIDVETKTLYMGSSDVDDDNNETATDYSMSEKAIKGLHILSNMADKENKPITIILNNPGGDEYHGYAIIGYMKKIIDKGIEINVEVYGQALSMGSIILQAASNRYMDNDAKLMIHYGTWSYDGHSLDFMKSAEECKKQCEKMEDVFLEKIKEVDPKFSRSKFQKMFSFDKYLTPDECLELGLIDEII